MEETRKIGDYSVKYSMYVGHKDIALGENPNADKDERYMCCFVETNAIFERYSGVLVSDDFAEIAKVFGQARSGCSRGDYSGKRESLSGGRHE